MHLLDTSSAHSDLTAADSTRRGAGGTWVLVKHSRHWLNFGNVWLFSRETRAVAGILELWIDLADARRLLARPAAVDRADFVTWSNVTRAELDLLAKAADPDDLNHYAATFDELPFHLGPCSLCYAGNL